MTKGDQLTWSFAESRSVTEPTYVDELPASETISDGVVFVIRNHESRYLTHTFHKYAGKFIPEIPRWAFRSYLPDTSARLVVDPFVGSGTTLVEASLVGARSIGIDVDPLARLIAKVKVTPLNTDELAAAVRDLLIEVDTSPPTGLRPSIPTLNHWFSPAAVDDLSAIKGLLERYRHNADLYDFLFICFSAIIRRASNADNQTMKTYVSHTHSKNPENARSLFKATLTDYSGRLLKYMQLRHESARSAILDVADARSLAATWQAAELPHADLGVTSPPYIRSVDYIYNQMAELFWVGDRWGLETQAKQNTFKRSYMGSDKVDRDAVHLGCAEDVPLTTRWVDSISGQNGRLGTVAAKYFSDTVAHFRSMSRILRPGSKYVYVVGDSTLAGVLVPTHQLVVECARTCGFELSLSFGYEIRNKHMRFPRGGNGGQVVHDWVLVFDVAGVAHGRSTRGSDRGGELRR